MKEIETLADKVWQEGATKRRMNKVVMDR
jgi:hypothetical protein